VKFKDFQGRNIELSDPSWEHIQESHPEISLEIIRSTNPNEVIECPKQQFVEFFYQIKLHPSGKERFRVIVVKVLQGGNFISTAMTTTAMEKGRSLYGKGDKK
jgi:hypothetical protein